VNTNILFPGKIINTRTRYVESSTSFRNKVILTEMMKMKVSLHRERKKEYLSADK